jgi:phage repressor protein C with HTH and peptisase S24 domain
MKFSERLKEIRKKVSLTQEDFALELGINRGAYKNYENGTSEPNIEVLKCISSRFKVDLNWLILGQKPDLKPDLMPDLNINVSLNPNLPENGRYNVILLEGVSALANPSGIPSQIQVMPDRLLWLPQLPLGRTYFAISVDGDSMQPFYQHSDTIVIAPAAGSEFREDRIYVCVLRDNTTIIKRLRWCRFGQYKGSIECVSENPRYSPIHIDPAEIHTLYEIWARLSIFPE